MSLDKTQALEALLNMNRLGSFTSGRYANLGGLGIFSMGSSTDPTAYQMMIFRNEFAEQPLPDHLVQTLNANLQIPTADVMV